MTDQFNKYSSSFQKAVSLQIEFILRSKDIKLTQQQIAFFKFVVNQTLAGKNREINDYTLATEVFGRGPDFNAMIDPIVNIQASILRRKLERYYQNTGKNDPILIDIPNGSYVPVFNKQKQNEF